MSKIMSLCFIMTIQYLTASLIKLDVAMVSILSYGTVRNFDYIGFDALLCVELRTCFCGGFGERIQIDSPCFCNLCQRSAFPWPCVPICCPSYMCPCALKHEIYVHDAQKGKYEIKRALQSGIYTGVMLMLQLSCFIV